MNLRDFIKPLQVLKEGGNLEIDGQAAQHIDLKVHNRAYIVPILNSLLNAINSGFQQQYQEPLWNPKLLKTQQFLSGSSLHFFNTSGIPDEEFQRVKPKVGDIDTQVNKSNEGNLEQYLNSVQGKIVGNAKCIGFQRGNEQFSSLWELTDPPIKVQIDLEFVKFNDKGDTPTAWSQFSHSSSWNDIQSGVKGVFHKFLIQSFTTLTEQEFLLRKFVGRGKARVEQDVPTTDNMLSFAVSSKEGGGLRAKYEPVVDEKGKPLVVNGLPVMRALPAEGYEQDIGKIFGSVFGKRINGPQMKKLESKFWSFTGLLEVMNTVLDQQEKEGVVDSFVNKLFAPGAQGLYKNDPERDIIEKNSALNLMLSTLKVTGPNNLEQMRSDYKTNYRMTSEAISKNVDSPELDEAQGDTAPAAVKAQFRKGMPHLHDLRPLDFLDLLDEIHDGNGAFKLQNIPLNVKVDGFGGRFGKNADGKPFMATSRTEPRYEPGFLKYHQQKGTQDPEILGRAQVFDNLFNEMMSAVQLVDSKLGPDFLTNKQVTCEVLFLPFATETPEGKLKFVGIHYDKLPKGVQLALVPFRVVEGDTGEDLPNSNEFIKQLLSVGRAGSVMFVDNSLVQKQGLDVTALVPPLENIEQLKAMLDDKSSGSLQRKRDVAAALDPVKIALEKAIIEDPNIIGKDILGKDYEGIVINSRLGPIKVTSQEQRDVIQAKQDAKKNAWTERPRENDNKTAVVAVGSFIGHKGHEELFNYTINKAKQVGGDPYLFIGNAEGKDDPIPPAVKVQTWHKLYPEYAKNISTVQAGGSLIQKIKHELINPLPGKPPRYDNIIIMVGEDRAGMNMPAALMKAVNKFEGYEHVKVSLDVTPRGTGISGTALRNSLKNDSPEKALATWSTAFDGNKLGVEWIKHLMDITRKGMGIAQTPTPVAERLSNALIRPRITETVRMSAVAKLSKAWDQQQQKSAASRDRAEKAKAEFEKQWKTKQEKGVAEAGRPFRGVGGAFNRGDDERHDLDPTDWYVVKDGKMFKVSVYPNQEQQATAQGYSRTRDEAKAKAAEQGVAEGAPIVVAPAPIDVRNPKKAPQPYRNQGDIVPPTTPPSTEKRGVKGRPGQRPMPNQDMTELFQLGKDWKWSFKGSQEAVAVFHIGEIPYQFYAYRPYEDQPAWDVEFKNAERGKDRITKFGLTGTGNSAEVMSTVADIMRAFLKEYQGKIKSLTFSANESSRQALYARMAKRLLPTWNLTQDNKEFTLSAPGPQTSISESKCIPLSEDVQNIMDVLINKIIFNEAVSNNKRRS